MAKNVQPGSRNAFPTDRPRTLIAESDAAILHALTQLFCDDCDTQAAADPSAAWACTREWAPDLVVADATMRSMRDFDFVRHLRAQEGGKVPIIWYSKRNEDDSSANTTDAAHDDAIVPFSEHQLLALVRAHVQVIKMRAESLQAIRLSEERFRMLQTTMTPGVWVAGPGGDLVGELAELAWWWETRTGQKPQQTAGVGWLDVVHPDDLPSVRDEMLTALRTKKPYQVEFRIKVRDGTYSYVRSQGAAVRDGHGNVREWVGTLFDIDDQKRAEAALRQSEERLRTFVAMTSLAVWTTNETGDLMDDVFAWTELTGQTPNQYRGRGWLDALHPEDRLRTLERWEQALRTATVLDAECRVRRRDGTYGYVRVSAVPVRNTDGTVCEWIGATIDIDARKRAEEALRTSEREFRANFELAGIGQAQTDPDTGRYIRVNDRFCEMVGYSRDELLTMTYLDITHPDEREAGRALLRFLREETGRSTTDQRDKRFVGKDGSIMWGLVTTTLIRNADGRPSHTITMIEDVTERRQSEALAFCQKRALEMVALGASLNEVLEFVILAVENQATRNLRGSICVLDKEGKRIQLCAAPSFPESYREALASFLINAQYMAGAVGVPAEPVIVLDLASDPRWAAMAPVLESYGVRSVWVTPIISSSQQLLGSFSLSTSEPRTPSPIQKMLIDNVARTLALVVERNYAEVDRDQLFAREQTARAMAEEANRLKDEFLAVVSHELRSPLSAVNGWAHLLLCGELDGQTQIHALQSIQRQVRSQSRLINDLLDIARITAGKVRLELRDVDLSNVINAALDSVRPEAAARRIHLEVALDPSVTRVVADPDRLQQVIWNLLSNAVKFTPEEGRVTIRSRRTEDGVEIVVADTGQGIADDFLPYVFDRFRQAEASAKRGGGGLGLGLAIVRQLVDLHNGTVKAASEGEGKGATFTIRLPMSDGGVPSALLDVPAEDHDALKGVRVLIVEDRPEDRAVLFAELTRHGATVTVSASTAEALIELDQFRPDVLVADIGMPGEDGYRLIRRVRSGPLEHGRLTPAIALTAFAGDANRARALEAGYQEHMAKPADPNELARTIVRLTHHPAAA
jgi:PAS domain S-box-containing protein